MTDADNRSPDHFKARIDHAMAHLDDFENPVMPECESDYLAMDEARMLLDHVNYRAEYGSAVQQHAARLVKTYADLVSRYNVRFELPAGDDRTIARYLLWNRYFSQVPDQVPWLEARDRGLLRKQAHVDGGHVFVVVGLRAKVGDNSFTVDGKGRHHRQYCSVIGRQAIYVRQPLPFRGEDLRAFAATVPELGESYYAASVGDGKYSVRPIALNGKERLRVYNLLMNSLHRLQPRIELPAAPPIPMHDVDQTPAVVPVNGDLFEAMAA